MTRAGMVRCDGCAKCDEHGAWVTLTLRLGTRDDGLHFCDWDCIILWAEGQRDQAEGVKP